MSKKHYVYKLSPTSFRVMQEALQVKQTLTYEGVADGGTNSLAYDYNNSTLFFINSDLKLYYIQSGDTTATLVSGFSSPSNQPGNAAYYNNAIWYFEFNSNVLVKLSLSYTSSVPSVSGKTTYSVGGMSLPAVSTVGDNTNTFGDIAIDPSTGTLYASTTRGRFYSIDLSSPTTSFNEIVAASSTGDRTLGLQLSYNNSTNVLYGHNQKTGNWYTINKSTGATTDLAVSTSSFRDLSGSSTTMYGNDSNGDIYTIDLTLSSPSTLDQFYLPKATDTFGANNLSTSIITSSPDQSFRIGIFNSTSDISVKVDWGDKSSTTLIAEGYQEHVYDDIFDGTINIQGDFGNGALFIGGKVKPVNTNGTWSNDYSAVDVVDGIAQINGISNISSIKLTNLRSLTSVPSTFFSNVTSSITNLDNTFENTGLTSIPSSLLTSMSNVTSYVATFRNCSSITSVPIPFFSVHSGITDMSNFLDWTVISNYDNFLDWLYTQANSVSLTGVTLGACGNSVSNSTGTTARANLINNLNWTILDGTCGITPTPSPTPSPSPSPSTPPPTPSVSASSVGSSTSGSGSTPSTSI